jgi:hypothetical protein
MTMPPGSVQWRTLQKALALAGSAPRLAEILRVPAPQLERWLEGTEEIPMPDFFNVVDFLLEQPAGFVTPARGRPLEGEPPSKNGSEDT